MIGVFDSGLGGLTALGELLSLLPSEDIVYFGDTGRVPYGSKSPETIIRYSVQDMNFLSSFGIDAALVACGTASSTALGELRRRFSLPIFGVIDAAVHAAAKATKNGKIGVIGTSATVGSGSFVKSLSKEAPDAEVISVACPLFVHLVEDGFTTPGDKVTLAAAERYLAPLRSSSIDTLILGCTHYPIISWAIEAVLPGVTLISSGKAAAQRLAEHVLSGEITTSHGSGHIRFYCSDVPDEFERAANVFLGGVKFDHAERIDISKY